MIAKVTLGLLLLAAAAADGDLDPRSLSQGIVIANLTTGYADQPYCVVNGRDGSWLCTVTHGDGTEGASGEKVITTRSTDKGATWTAAIEVEPQAPSEYAYSTLLGAGAADSRVFVLWVENSDNVTELPGVGPITRTDMLGHYWLKWSDDGGASWSDERVEVPLRATKIDRENSFNGSVMMSWNVDKGVVGRSGAVYVAISKIGTYCVDPPTSSWVLRSADLLDPTVAPSDATWATLPEGDDGIHNWDAATPGIAEEPHVVPLASYDDNDDVEDALYLIFRTDDGYLGARSSVDSGRSWQPLAPAGSDSAQFLPLPSCAAAGAGAAPLRRLKNPRGPTMLRFVPREYLERRGLVGDGEDQPKLREGEAGVHVLLWYFNEHAGSFYNRNPYWLSVGFEASAESGLAPQVLFTDPEVALFNDAPGATEDKDPLGPRGPGYPDFILDDEAGVIITETEKIAARAHAVDDALLSALIGSRDATGAPPGAALAYDGEPSAPMPPLPALETGRIGGFTITLWWEWQPADNDENDLAVLFDTRKGDGGAGVAVEVERASGAARAVLVNASGVTVANLSTVGCGGGGCANATARFAAFVIDGGVRVLSAFADGVLCDGGDLAEQGWMVAPSGDFNGAANATLAGPPQAGALLGLSLYTRALLTSELLATFRAGPPSALGR